MMDDLKAAAKASQKAAMERRGVHKHFEHPQDKAHRIAHGTDFATRHDAGKYLRGGAAHAEPAAEHKPAAEHGREVGKMHGGKTRHRLDKRARGGGVGKKQRIAIHLHLAPHPAQAGMPAGGAPPPAMPVMNPSGVMGAPPMPQGLPPQGAMPGMHPGMPQGLPPQMQQPGQPMPMHARGGHVGYDDGGMVRYAGMRALQEAGDPEHGARVPGAPGVPGQWMSHAQLPTHAQLATRADGGSVNPPWRPNAVQQWIKDTANNPGLNSVQQWIKDHADLPMQMHDSVQQFIRRGSAADEDDPQGRARGGHVYPHETAGSGSGVGRLEQDKAAKRKRRK